MGDGYKEVRFDQYCSSCEYRDMSEKDDPCDECLSEPVNLQSVKPIKYKEKG